jgi:hypothetical protein
MKKIPAENETFTGNDQYRGYCVEMLQKIAALCNFTYQIKLVDDGFHGAYVNGKWNGIVSELIDKVIEINTI